MRNLPQSRLRSRGEVSGASTARMSARSSCEPKKSSRASGVGQQLDSKGQSPNLPSNLEARTRPVVHRSPLSDAQPMDCSSLGACAHETSTRL